MQLVLSHEAPPLCLDASGAYRVGKTRVLLELVIDAHRESTSPEEIVDRYPSLEIADVYAVIAYYLRHRVEVDAYMAERDDIATHIQEPILATPEAKQRAERLRYINT